LCFDIDFSLGQQGFEALIIEIMVLGTWHAVESAGILALEIVDPIV
jgi:hypothetical protein